MITPLIAGPFRLGAPEPGRTLIETAENGVLVAVLAVGLPLAAQFGPRRFLIARCSDEAGTPGGAILAAVGIPAGRTADVLRNPHDRPRRTAPASMEA